MKLECMKYYYNGFDSTVFLPGKRALPDDVGEVTAAFTFSECSCQGRARVVETIGYDCGISEAAYHPSLPT